MKAKYAARLIFVEGRILRRSCSWCRGDEGQWTKQHFPSQPPQSPPLPPLMGWTSDGDPAGHAAKKAERLGSPHEVHPPDSWILLSRRLAQAGSLPPIWQECRHGQKELGPTGERRIFLLFLHFQRLTNQCVLRFSNGDGKSSVITVTSTTTWGGRSLFWCTFYRYLSCTSPPAHIHSQVPWASECKRFIRTTTSLSLEPVTSLSTRIGIGRTEKKSWP